MYQNLIKFFQQIAADPKMPPLPDHLEDDYIKPLMHIIDNHGCLSEWFEYLDEGSYKQVYEFGDNYVLKLLTAGEQLLDINLPDYFLKTFNFYLPRNTLVWDNCIPLECGRYCNNYCTIGIQIQPRAVLNDFPSTEIDEELFVLGAIKDWADDFRAAYGESEVENLLKLHERYGIDDLHCNNIAYFKGKPVIIDYYAYYKGD